MPAPASATRAEWLKQKELSVPATDATMDARWGEDALDSTQSSLIVLQGAATTEANRQLAFLARPRGRDVVTVDGIWFDLEGETVDIDYAGCLGLNGIARLLVVRTRVDLNAGVTEIEGEVLI